MWARLALQRWNVSSLLGRLLDLRHVMTPYDASDVALAEAIKGRLGTRDARLAAAATGVCVVELFDERMMTRHGAACVFGDQVATSHRTSP